MLTTEKIAQAVRPLAVKYNIIQVDLFGSYATGNATEDSDVDVLVKFDIPVPSIFAVMGFREELSNRLSHPVDIVTLPITRPDIIKIDKVVNIYERAR